MSNLRFGVDFETANRICSYNRIEAELAWYHEDAPRTFLREVKDNPKGLKYFDSVTGKLLFEAPKDRTIGDFLLEC